MGPSAELDPIPKRLFIFPIHDRFWITSHEDKTLYLWDPAKGLLATYAFNLKKMEGVAVDPAAQRLYSVDEQDDSLHSYRIGTDY